MVSGTYGAATAIGAAASFSASDLAAVLEIAKNYPSKNLLLDWEHLARLLPSDKTSFRLGEQGAYGFDIIAEQNRWTSAETNACGFLCNPAAIAVLAGPPADGAAGRNILSRQAFTVEPLGLPVVLHTWFNTKTRTVWHSFDVMFGAAVGDATAGEVLVTS